MSKRKVEINPVWADNLRRICKEQGITQANLAARIPITQQLLSRLMTGKATLTETTAHRIIKLYPEYRFNWLIGDDEYPTEHEQASHLLLDKLWLDDQQRERVEKLLLVHGYSIERLFDPQTGLPAKGNTVLRIAPDTSDKNILSLAHSARPQVLVSISGADGKQLQIEDDIYAHIWKDISDYARMKMQLLFEREAKSDG